MNDAPRLLLKSTKDALLIVEAAERGIFPRLVRRLTDQERANHIRSGAIFVYDEYESNIKRFTDTLVWSPSRIVGNYLVYREMRKHEPRPTSRAAAAFPPQPSSARSLARPRPESVPSESDRARKRREQIYVGSLTNSDKFKSDGLVKRTFSLICEGKHIHVISYYTYEDAMNERFETPSGHKDFAGLTISSSLLQDLSAFRVPPRVEKHSDGQVVYAGDDTGGLESPHSGSASLDTDHESPVTTSSTYEPSEVLTLPPIILPDDYTFDLPPLRPLPSRSHTAWENAPMLSPSAYESSPYSSQGRSDQPSYSFSSNSAPSFTTLPAPSLTPPPTRPIPRLRDGRQHPYPQRPAGIVRGYREPEHAPSATSVMGAEESPSYSQSPGLWAIPPSREGTATPVLIRPSLAAYEVGPSGETVEYDVPEGRWTPNSGLSPMYSGTHGARY